MKDVVLSVFESGCLCFAWYIITKMVYGAVLAYIKEKMRSDVFLRLKASMGEMPTSWSVFCFIWTVLTFFVWGVALYNVYLSIQTL